ncbi:tetratricopeptide repeat protein [Flavobacterium sp.]|uniref:tetratricopeptide repeat protein n=1 Tax=Flavobacterium sp. TaxID=239 RepID=UPI0040475F64
MTKLLITLLSFCFIQCQGQTKKNETDEEKKTRQEAIIKEHVYDCADKIHYTTQMYEYQKCLDEGIKKDSTIAYLWQQKAMPYYKARKYSVGKPFLDKAVQYDEKRWLSYRAFMKCIFSKDYKGVIEDFETCIKKYGNSYEMDHTYSFYIGLSYLQLNEFEKAAKIFKQDIEEQSQRLGEGHFLDLFYYGISKYEQQKWEEAIVQFDKSLQQYPEFSDAEFYKAICLMRMGKKEEASLLLVKAKKDVEKGYTINEDNAIYETYPYKVRW